MKLSAVHSVAEFRALARRRLPRFAFDFVDGAAGGESGIERNAEALRSICLTPRIGSDPTRTDLKTTLFGRTYSAPFGVAPLGLCGLVHPEADTMLARAATRAGLPTIASAASNTAIEKVADACGEAPWFQLYAPKSEACRDRLVQRVERLGCPVLVVTVDTAAPGKRLRDLRNGLRLPYRPSLSNIAEALRHPVWTARRLAAGPVQFPNLAHPDGAGAAMPHRELMAWQTGGTLDWATLAQLRRQWPRAMLLKGVLSAEDAKTACAMGMDGVIVSNHGGRQFESSAAPAAVLPGFAAQGLGPEFLMMDSGLRSGEDILKALTLGAGFTFLGRPFLFALAAGGEAGVQRLLELLLEDLGNALRLAGVATPAGLPRAGLIPGTLAG